MRTIIVALLAGLALAGTTPAEPVSPVIREGYQLVYEQNFDDPSSIDGFEFTSPEKWIYTTQGLTGGALEFTGPGAYEPKVRSPKTIGLIADRQFGSFILEADFLQTGRDYGHRDMCIFLNFTDPAHFYYVHIATKADPNAHNVFIVNDAPRKNIARETTEGVDWGREVWRHVRIERNAESGEIKVYYTDMTTPIMIAEDKTFQEGGIGFGSFDDSGRIDNLRIWAPKPAGETPTKFFTRKKDAPATPDAVATPAAPKAKGKGKGKKAAPKSEGQPTTQP